MRSEASRQSRCTASLPSKEEERKNDGTKDRFSSFVIRKRKSHMSSSKCCSALPSSSICRFRFFDASIFSSSCNYKAYHSLSVWSVHAWFWFSSLTGVTIEIMEEKSQRPEYRVYLCTEFFSSCLKKREENSIQYVPHSIFPSEYWSGFSYTFWLRRSICTFLRTKFVFFL